jgi:hypothetical protein
MSGKGRPLLLMAVFATAAGVAAALVWGVWSSGENGSQGGDRSLDSWPGIARTAEVGGIEVEATWLSKYGGSGEAIAEYPLDRFVLIRVGFTTHSGDLRGIDMEQSAALTQGGSRIGPEGWISLSDDSHHRAGVLVFARVGEGDVAELVLSLEEGTMSFVWDG